ncbi:MAG: rRNA maturation RNase YbeY [Desulfobacterales bacterium]|nr:rRNA maturation RNase YbeY [Desulfobacteraceae bacterium]MBT4365318.1 rRNA maturation RNase YbeY [Desulfobacteraceae bacterium]MBT7085554.1 rRNA maturation RNase YbeY [Desulfobacterales bacterium]MBT7695929.1 rRNA maturation RNase YbeY [Desulfobacterales bacterium]
MAILIDNRQNIQKIHLKKVQQKAQVILNALDNPDAELSILIVDDPQIEILNRKYLNREGPTNVIAFPMLEGDFSQISPQLLGDVVVSIETAERERINSGLSLEERFTQLIIHGILHLFGYDHEEDENEAELMERKSNDLLKFIESGG